MIKINQAFYLNRLDHSPLVDPMSGYQAGCRLCRRGDLHSVEAHRAEMQRPEHLKAIAPRPGYTLNAPAPVVDPSKQFGLFERGADGEPVEIGERPGQGVLFHDTPKAPPAKPSADDLRRSEGLRAMLPMFGE